MWKSQIGGYRNDSGNKGCGSRNYCSIQIRPMNFVFQAKWKVSALEARICLVLFCPEYRLSCNSLDSAASLCRLSLRWFRPKGNLKSWCTATALSVKRAAKTMVFRIPSNVELAVIVAKKAERITTKLVIDPSTKPATISRMDSFLSRRLFPFFFPAFVPETLTVPFSCFSVISPSFWHFFERFNQARWFRAGIIEADPVNSSFKRRFLYFSAFTEVLKLWP